MAQYETDTRICGIPVTVEYDIEGADLDVGMSEDVGDWSINRINGRKVKGYGAQWLYSKFDKASIGDRRRFFDSLYEAARG